MRERYRMYQRKGGMFYAKDRKTGQRLSLNTTDKADAKRLLAAKNQATEQPYLNVSMAKVYLSAQSPEFFTRTWGTVLDHLAQSYEGATADHAAQTFMRGSTFFRYAERFTWTMIAISWMPTMVRVYAKLRCERRFGAAKSTS
jgi:hypothetical protein